MIYAIIPAAGRGERFGGKTKKQFIRLGDTPILIRTLAVFEKSSLVDEIITVVSKDDHSFAAHLISGYSLSKAKRIVPGGERRQDSILAAVALIEGEGRPEDIVLVHDGVRPLVSVLLIEKVIWAAERVGCAVAAMPTGDSLKEVSGKKEIIRSVPRENIW
ncbi:MAG: 2-C-methyl-D-erythritol 4-phosphate cytidylyltransferase, partial [Nitrospiria bacterium]